MLTLPLKTSAFAAIFSFLLIFGGFVDSVLRFQGSLREGCAWGMKINLPPGLQSLNGSAFVWPTWLNNIHGNGNLFGGVENGNFILDHLWSYCRYSG
jgi:hypothetical protein